MDAPAKAFLTLSIARWLVPKLAKKNFQSIYKKHIHFHVFCIYSWRGLLEAARLFLLDAEACGLLKFACMIRGTGAACCFDLVIVWRNVEVLEESYSVYGTGVDESPW
jgi:hypothetical protein